MNITAEAPKNAKTAGKIIGYAMGRIKAHTPSENGAGTNMLVLLPEPIGEINVYVSAERALPAVDTDARFVAIQDEGALTPHIRLAGRLTTAAVSEVFTLA